mgnify:FL=1
MLREEDYEEITKEIQAKGQLTELLLLKLIASFLNIEEDEDIENWRDKNLLLVNQMAKKAQKIINTNGVTDNDISKTLNLAITTALYNQDLIYKMALDKGLIKNKAGDATKKAYYKQVLTAAIKNTRKYKNAVNTTALNMSKKAFRDIINQTYLDVSTGSMSHIDAVERATKALASKGITGINYISEKGKPTRRTVSSAIRTMIVTSTSQTAGLMQLERANDWGQDLVEVSSHSGARPSHAKWQGKIYSISGKHPKYAHLTTETKYGTIEGLKGINCTHDFYPFFEGLSQQTFKPTSDFQKNSEIYEQSQKQREYERKLRKENTEKEVQKAAGLKVDEEASETEKQYRQFLKDTGRTRRAYREI